MKKHDVEIRITFHAPNWWIACAMARDLASLIREEPSVVAVATGCPDRHPTADAGQILASEELGAHRPGKVELPGHVSPDRAVLERHH